MICIHLLGGTSPAHCSNNALRRTAVDNGSVLGKTSETLQKDFYVIDRFPQVFGRCETCKVTSKRCH